VNTNRAEENQEVLPFAGDGAYRGANKSCERPIPDFEPDESKPLTLINHESISTTFHAAFWDNARVVKQLNVPSQEDIKNEPATFVFEAFDSALKNAGPLTRSVLLEMEPLLERKKKFIYVDSKIQYFEAGDTPVDSKLWHIDGIISVRDKRATELGYPLLHDLKARMMGAASPPKYLAYQSSTHCATQYVKGTVMVVELPACISSFDPLDQAIENLQPPYFSQPAGSIVSFDGFSLHRAVPANASGWRLWIRCSETDREIKLSSSAQSHHGTVYRMNDDSSSKP